MVFGHAAAGSLCQQFWLRRFSPWFCLAAAFGPDWIDKALKLVFGLPGHGLAHSLIGSAMFVALLWFGCVRAGLSARLPACIAFFWGLHLLCDWVHAEVLFWPLLGPFPVNATPTATLAFRFYTSWPLIPLARVDIALTILAVAARLGPWFVRRPVLATILNGFRN